MTPRARRILGTTLLCSGLLSLGIGLRLWFPSDSYDARARVKIEPNISRVSETSSITNEYDPYLFQSQFDLLQSETILGKVVESHSLAARWSKRDGRTVQNAEAVTMLKARMEVRPVRCTSLVEIHITSKDPDEAAKIANAITEEYRNQLRTGGPKKVLAEIVDAAAIPRLPVNPNRVPASCWLGFGSLLVGAGVLNFAKRRGEVN